MKNDTRSQKETKSHAGITDDMKDRSDQTVIIINPNPAHHVADFRDNEVGQHSFNLPLR